MSTSWRSWSSACSVGEVAPGDGVQPRPPLRESGPLASSVHRAVISCPGGRCSRGCARRRASATGPNVPRYDVRHGSRPAPPDRGVSMALVALPSWFDPNGVATSPRPCSGRRLAVARDGDIAESNRRRRRARASGRRPACPDVHRRHRGSSDCGSDKLF